AGFRVGLGAHLIFTWAIPSRHRSATPLPELGATFGPASLLRSTSEIEASLTPICGRRLGRPILCAACINSRSPSPNFNLECSVSVAVIVPILFFLAVILWPLSARLAFEPMSAQCEVNAERG